MWPYTLEWANNWFLSLPFPSIDCFTRVSVERSCTHYGLPVHGIITQSLMEHFDKEVELDFMSDTNKNTSESTFTQNSHMKESKICETVGVVGSPWSLLVEGKMLVFTHSQDPEVATQLSV